MKTTQLAEKYLEEMVDSLPLLLYNDVFEISKTAGSVLNYLLKSEEEVNSGDLTNLLKVSSARTAALLKRMEEQGLITRKTSSTDGRCTIVEITEKGKDFILGKNRKFLGKIEEVIEEIGTDELDKFIEISRKIQKMDIF